MGNLGFKPKFTATTPKYKNRGTIWCQVPRPVRIEDLKEVNPNFNVEIATINIL